MELNVALRGLFIAALPLLATPVFSRSPSVDHHQHLMNAAMVDSADKAIDAKLLIERLDAAGIKSAVVLSNAFVYGNPRPNPLADDYARVMAENDWTLSEALNYPGRLVVFCSFNPLRDYALTELDRCAQDERFGRGIKLQFAASDVNLDDAGDIEKVRKVFEAANANRTLANSGQGVSFA